MTQYFILITLVVITIYDIWTYKRHGVQSTISRITIDWTRKAPFILVALGYVLGHLTWGQSCE